MGFFFVRYKEFFSTTIVIFYGSIKIRLIRMLLMIKFFFVFVLYRKWQKVGIGNDQLSDLVHQIVPLNRKISVPPIDGVLYIPNPVN